MAVFVGKMKRRHRLAGLRGRRAGSVLAQPRHQPVDRLREIGPPSPCGVGKRPKLLVQRGVHAADALECLLEVFPDGVGCHSTIRK